MTQKALILGASGRFGRHAKHAFEAAGWRVAAFDRAKDTLEVAASGVDVIVNAWNPAYPQWASDVPRLHAAVRAAATLTGATVVIPGNVYVFGSATPHPWSETSPHAASNPLGRIRIEMEAAYARDGVRTIVLRAGDFLDTEASGNWFDRIMAPTLPKGALTYPGRPDIPHAWAYLPDLARAAVALAERRDTLPAFADVPFAGYTLSGEDIAAQLSATRGRSIAIKRFNWLPLQISRPFWPMGRCLLEMRYLWNTPHSLDGTRFDTLVPGFEHTAVDEALRASAAHL